MSQPETTEQAAAGLGALILAEAAAGGHPVGVFNEETAEPTVAEHVAAQIAQRVAPSTPAPAAEAVPFPLPVESVDVSGYVDAAEANSGLPDFTPLTDDELDTLLTEPDIDAEVEQEAVAAAAEYGDTFDPDEFRRVRSLEKRNEWLESQLVAKSKQGWVAENLRKYPLLNTYFADEVKSIDATSRRGFAKAAAEMNTRYAAALSGPLSDIAALRAGTKAEAKAEARTEAAQQWGLPVGDPAGSAAAEVQAEVDAELAAARQRGAGLAERIAIMAKTQKVL